MLLISQILLVIAGILLIVDASFMFARRPNPLKGLPLPCPVTLIALGIGIILFIIASF